MNFALTDWIVFIGMIILLISVPFIMKKYVKGVAHFLVAGRNVGRFLGLESDSMAGLGAITILAMWQMNYKSGFVGHFWFLLTPITAALIALTGWGVFRYRLTRAMTLGQFVEQRYSKRARIAFGFLAYFAGILNMGIFPAAGAHFFTYYIGLPLEIFGVPTTVLLVFALVSTAATIAINGGQVTIVVSNFIQALFINTLLIGIMIVIYNMFSWEQVSQAFLSAPNAEAMLHPFSDSGEQEFGKMFFLIGVFWMIYWVISWSPNALVTSSASDAHEAKMMRVFVEIKKLVYMGLGIGVIPIAVYVIMHHPDFAGIAETVNATLATIENEQIRSQMVTVTGMKYILPVGIFGAFGGLVLFAYMSTDTSYLLSWGSILIQDVIIPIRGGKPLDPKRHMMWIRFSILFVASFIIMFSIFFPQVDNIYMFLDLTGGLYLSSAGVILLGGLYWKRGNTKGAWAAMITGAVLTIIGFFGRLAYPDFLDGRILSFYITLISIAVYVITSIFTKSEGADLDKILAEGRKELVDDVNRKWYKLPKYIPKWDKFLVPFLYIAIAAFILAFIGVWIYNSVVDVPIQTWLNFWQIYLYVMFFGGSVFMLVLIFGGFKNIIAMFKGLKTQEVNTKDDGRVE